MDTPTWTELEPFLDQALDTPATERESWLADLARARPEIAETLRGLLRQRDELDARGFLEKPLAPPAPTLAGVQVGSYTIRALIGRGGMGEVWLADRSDGRFEGRFAVKFLDAYAASAAGLDRFRREGRLLARLAHEHIARLIDAGVTSSERPYLVLEYIEGERIDRYCETHSLGVQARVRLVLDVLAAVAHAHANLIVHRDIKPSNVLVTAAGSAKLLDFGIAKLVTADDSGASVDAPTRLEDAALTPEYAAPEQILGEPASTATDVYQLGVLLFVLLAGRLPLAAAGNTRAERIKAALDAEPPRLSDAAPPAWRKELRGDLDAIVGKALRKVPRERYATAVALAEDLRLYLGHRPVQARADVMSYRVSRFARRYRGVVIGTAAAMLVLLGVTAFALVQMREAQRQRDVSREQARRAERQAEFATLMMSTVGDRQTTAVQLFGAGERLLRSHYPDDPVFRINGLLNMAERYADLGETQKQDELTREAAQLAPPLHDTLLNTRVECALADTNRGAGNMPEAKKHLDEGFRQLAQVSEPDATYVSDCLQARAEFESEEGRVADAIQTDLEALRQLERGGERSDSRYPAVLGRISDFYKQRGDTQNGYEYTRRALESVRANGQEDTDSFLTHTHNLAGALLGFGEYKESCALEAQVVKKYEATGREQVPNIAGVYSVCRIRFNDAEDALRWADVAQRRADAGTEVSIQIFTRYCKARALALLRRFTEADALMRQIDELGAKSPDSLREMLMRAHMVGAEVLLAEGRLAEARAALDPLIATLHGPDAAKSVRWLPAVSLTAARVAVAQQRYADAAAAARVAFDGYAARARRLDDSGDVGEAALVLAQALRGIKDEAGGRKAAEQALRSFTSQFGEDSPQAQRARALIG